MNIKIGYHSKTPLILASYNGHTEIVKLLLAAGADVNHTDSDGKSALMWATKGEIVDMLIAAGSNIKIRSRREWTPLMHDYRSDDMLNAFLFGSNERIDPEPEVTKSLIKAGVDVNAKNDHSDTALHMACKGGDTESVKLLIEAGADVNAANEYGETPLHVAGNGEITKALLAAGAKVDVRDDQQQTPLHYKMNTETVRALLAAGADVNAKDELGHTPLESISGGGNDNPEVMKMLLDAGADVNSIKSEGRDGRMPIHFAKSPETIDVLLAAGADINATAENGWTPLHNAVAYVGNAQTISKMLAVGANVNARDKNGMTPLMLAARENKPLLAKLLIQAGANVNETANDGSTALLVAACGSSKSRNSMAAAIQEIMGEGVNVEYNDGSEPEHRSSAVIQELLKAGADINAKVNAKSALDCVSRSDYPAARTLLLAGAEAGDNLRPLLRIASVAGDEQVAKLLAPLETDKSSSDANGCVISASSWGNAETLRVLLEAGFNPNASNDTFTALTITNSYLCLKTLLESGADVNLPDPTGWTAFDKARMHMLDKNIELLKNAGAKGDR